MIRRGFIRQTGIVLSGMFIPGPLFIHSKNSKMKAKREYDVIIIGGSYSGLAAGMALVRALREVLIIDAGNPCNKQTPHSHNFLTNDGRTPGDITNIATQQVQAYPTIDFLNASATSASKIQNGFEVQIESGEVFTARRIVHATGIKDVLPDIPGFAECWGISVLHCPYCHGYEVRHQTTGILTNGDNGYDFATLISNWTNDLTLYTNGKSTLTDQQTAKLNQHNINIVETEIAALQHSNGYMKNIIFKDGTTASVTALYAKIPFVQHSQIPQSLGCELTPEGYIKVDAMQKTTVPGVFACGDNSSRMRTVANAVATGTTTGMVLNRELIDENF
jgi:thioredoxin reductase